MLNEVPMRGAGTPMPPTDPLIYRFYELVMVNGPAWKALIEEEYGDGIMSAIDFDMVMERLPNPKGDRVKMHDVRKIPAVQYYGASGTCRNMASRKGRHTTPDLMVRSASSRVSNHESPMRPSFETPRCAWLLRMRFV